MFSNIGNLTVVAPSFDDPGKQVTLEVDASWILANAAYARRQPLMDFWALVQGTAPPVNNIGYHEGGTLPDLPGLKAAHALFCGLKRPIDDADHDGEVYVFVTLPKLVYRYLADMVCVAKVREAPKNAVFACYVRRYQQETADGISGRILSWEWVRAEPTTPMLPQDWQERYQAERWRTI